VDNAAANAGLIALAHFAAALEKPHPTFVFCAHPGHEVNVGAREFVASHADLLKRAFVYLSLDGFGSTGYFWDAAGVVPTGTDEKRGISVSDNPLLLKHAIEVVKKHRLLPAAYVPASDIIFNRDLEGHFYHAGVPFIMIIGKPIWYHTVEDTPDKIRPDHLMRSYQAHAELLTRIIETGAERIRAHDRKTFEDTIAAVLPVDRQKAGWQTTRGLAFGFLPEPAFCGEPILFFIREFSNLDEVLIDLSWEFGDGKTGRGPVAFNIYEQPGRYEITVRVTDSAGYESSYQRVLWVQD
jgi:hypothetical protein